MLVSSFNSYSGTAHLAAALVLTSSLLRLEHHFCVAVESLMCSDETLATCDVLVCAIT